MRELLEYVSRSVSAADFTNLVVAIIGLLFGAVYFRLLSRIGPDKLVRAFRLLLVGPSVEPTFPVDITSRAREKSEKRSKTLRAAVVNGIRNGAVASLNDVSTLLAGVSIAPGHDDAWKRRQSRRMLQSLLVDALAAEEPALPPDDPALAKVRAFIAEKDWGGPFTDLAERERNLFQDAMAFIQGGDQENAIRKLSEISSIFVTRDEDIVKLQAANRTTLWLTVFGFVSSVAFGLIAVLK